MVGMGTGGGNRGAEGRQLPPRSHPTVPTNVCTVWGRRAPV